MADEENAENKQEEKPEAAAPEGEAAGTEVKKKGGGLIYASVGGGAALVVGIAFFLAQAAVQTEVTAQDIIAAAENRKQQDDALAGEEAEHATEGEATQAEGHGAEGEGNDAEGAPDALNAPPEDKTKHISLGDFTVNAKESNLGGFIRANIGVIVETDLSSADLAAKFNEEGYLGAIIRDQIVMHLRNLRMNDLEGDLAVKVLKKDLAKMIEKIAFPDGNGKITVVFRELLAQ